MNQRIGSSPLTTTSPIARPKDARTRAKSDESDFRKYAPPHRAQFNYIPSPDVLKNMIDRALEALAKGVYWDRGSIINLLL